MHKNIEIRKSGVHGKGVFASNFISKGTNYYSDVVEVDSNVLYRYQYPWGKDKWVICLGFGSFINHSRQPNIEFVSIVDETMKAKFVITADINPGEEILMFYHKGFEDIMQKKGESLII